DKVLKNPLYYGTAFRWKGKLYPANHEPIISKKLFDEVQNVLTRKSRTYKSRKNFAFANLLHCGECGCRVLGEEKKKRYTYYHCSFSKGRHNGIGYIPENRLTEMFEDSIIKVTLTEDKAEWLKQAFKEHHSNTYQSVNNRLIRLQTDYAQANTRLSKLYDLKIDGGIPEDIFKAKEKEYQNDLITLKSQIANVEKVNPNFFEDACKILELSKSLHSQYLKADYHEKGNLLKLVASNYTLNDVSVCPTYRRPFSFIAEWPLCLRKLPREGSNLGQTGYDLT
ncbi:MAG: recombinase zinc beta ribbon domain-containing protein, partial [Candidatus Omnitrophica bacterium]|nr:recombinase zinc beta ribbon domain-containing protein [Candidatus Omnitrophota bacterium]